MNEEGDRPSDFNLSLSGVGELIQESLAVAEGAYLEENEREIRSTSDRSHDVLESDT